MVKSIGQWVEKLQADPKVISVFQCAFQYDIFGFHFNLIQPGFFFGEISWSLNIHLKIHDDVLQEP